MSWRVHEECILFFYLVVELCRDLCDRVGYNTRNHHHVRWRSGCSMLSDWKTSNNEGWHIRWKARCWWVWNALGVRFSSWELTQGLRENLQESDVKGHQFIEVNLLNFSIPRKLNTEERVTKGFLIWFFFYLEMSLTWCGNNWNVAN